jgi:hypothetical protein
VTRRVGNYVIADSHEGWAGRGLPGFGGLPAHPTRTQDLPDTFRLAHHGDIGGGQVFGELG